MVIFSRKSKAADVLLDNLKVCAKAPPLPPPSSSYNLKHSFEQLISEDYTSQAALLADENFWKNIGTAKYEEDGCGKEPEQTACISEDHYEIDVPIERSKESLDVSEKLLSSRLCNFMVDELSESSCPDLMELLNDGVLSMCLKEDVVLGIDELMDICSLVFIFACKYQRNLINAFRSFMQHFAKLHTRTADCDYSVIPLLGRVLVSSLDAVALCVDMYAYLLSIQDLSVTVAKTAFDDLVKLSLDMEIYNGCWRSLYNLGHSILRWLGMARIEALLSTWIEQHLGLLLEHPKGVTNILGFLGSSVEGHIAGTLLIDRVLFYSDSKNHELVNDLQFIQRIAASLMEISKTHTIEASSLYRLLLLANARLLRTMLIPTFQEDCTKLLNVLRNIKRPLPLNCSSIDIKWREILGRMETHLRFFLRVK